MDRDQDVEVELYEENVGNLNSTPNESRSSSPGRFLPVLSSQEPTQRRLEEILFVAIDPRPDPEELSHAPTSQVPRIHDSCHTIQLSRCKLTRAKDNIHRSIKSVNNRNRKQQWRIQRGTRPASPPLRIPNLCILYTVQKCAIILP